LLIADMHESRHGPVEHGDYLDNQGYRPEVGVQHSQNTFVVMP